jgi:hypothetical protein
VALHPDFEALFRVPATIGGVAYEIKPRIPKTGDEAPFYGKAMAVGGQPSSQGAMTFVLKGFIDTIDGKPLTWPEANALSANPTTRVNFLELRRRLYTAFVMDGGAVYLRCPHCSVDKLLVDVFHLTSSLNAEMWPIAEANGDPAVPSLGRLDLPLAARHPGSVLATGARLLLPSARTGLGGPFSEAVFASSPTTPAREAEAWQRWTRASADGTFENPGFRAIVRAALALDRLDGNREVTPEMIESLPVCDFLFIDSVHYLLRNVGILDFERAAVPCPACGERFMLALPT